ncbi:MAG: peptide-methionine (R)-S-oxide reductase [Robiginitomaculum sp.]|nr:MAG: peptide-methionine (R)-S-oxide reductase [Robiginitomaculum sp.]
MSDENLTPEQRRIARSCATEAPFSGPWLDEKRAGIYTCIACDTPLFDAAHKYDSGSGWPSFFNVISPNALGQHMDSALAMTRNEIHCAKCEAHMGHVFEDGPMPTGLRYCVNGTVLNFTPKD